MSQREIALKYAEMGIAVFPCSPSKKSPMVEGGENFCNASTDPATIKKWWKNYPRALVGAPNSQFIVLDIDTHKLSPMVETLNELAHDKLISSGIVNQSCLEVNTKNGGTHYYFKPNKELTRQIKILPSIDLLGNGGYCILPDQSTYTAVNSDKPWEYLAGDDLPEFPKEEFIQLLYDMEETMDIYRSILKEASMTKKKQKQVGIKNPIDTNSRTLPKRELRGKNCAEGPNISKSFKIQEDEETKHSIDYESGRIEFDQEDGMYAKKENVKPSEFVVEFDEDGYVHLDRKINTDVVNALFHDPRVQVRLGELIGLKAPKAGHKSLQRSVIPSHRDEHSSMGVRWNQEGTHLLIRDFANHFSDKYNQVDYNVVRLYATCHYGALVPRMRPPEFVVWFIRMLVEAHVLKAPERKKYGKTYEECDHASEAKVQVAEGLLYLDSIKSMYEGYDELTVYADRFSSAWSGVSPSTAQEAKRWLIDQQLAYHHGFYDCSAGKRDDGFYQTRIFSIIEGKHILKCKPPKFAQPTNKKEDKQPEVEQGQWLDTLLEKDDMSDETIITTIEMPVSQTSYDQILAFAEDSGIENVPERQNMIFVAGASDELTEVKVSMNQMSLYASGLSLQVYDNADGDAKILVLNFHEYDEMERKFVESVKQLTPQKVFTDEPINYIIISNDYDEDSGDIRELSNKISIYLDEEIRFDEIVQKFNTRDQYVNRVLNGRADEA